MKISELIETLQKRLGTHGDVDVEITWEGVQRGIDSSSIYLSKDGPLYIDGDGEGLGEETGDIYKPRFAVDPLEGVDEPTAIEHRAALNKLR